VPFFLGGPLAFCTGRGEKIRELDSSFHFAAHLILPGVNVSTAKVYANYVHDARLYESLRRSVESHLRENRIDLLARMCVNMLERSCFHLFAELGVLKNTIEDFSVGPVCLSGSGSAMFCIPSAGSLEILDSTREKITDKTNCQCVVVRNNRW
jgi:4-diphosphocytidyl-2-C-methyl-D-erythritol kinase